MKVCCGCKQEYPATPKHFYRKSAAKDGLQAQCKKCAKKDAIKYQKKYRQTINGKNMKKKRDKKYSQTVKGKATHKRGNKKYRQTLKGKIAAKRGKDKYKATVNGHLHCIFQGMVRRCTDPKHKGYKTYGERGIRVCFKSAKEFIDYVVNELQVDFWGLTIDRIDNDGNYERGNIQFITREENNRKGRK